MALQPATVRRDRIASIMLLITLIVSIAFLPAALTSDGLHVLPPDIGMFVVAIVGILLNRQGKVILVGVLLIAALDFALAYSLIFYPHFTLTQNAVPIYDLFVLSDIIAVSLLPINSILYVSFFHSVFMCADIVIQPHTPDLAQLLSETGYSIMVRPLTIQIVVAIVTFLWVKASLQAIERANRAEQVAELERAISKQKQELEEGIQQLLHVLVQATNGNLQVRTPLARDHVLWQLDVAINTLLSRLQRSNMSAQEYQKIRGELLWLIQVVQQAKEQRTMVWHRPGGTELDPLITELLGCYVIQPPTGSRTL